MSNVICLECQEPRWEGIVCECNPDACPGCGCEPGDGVTEDCEHPDGCGWAKEVHGA